MNSLFIFQEREDQEHTGMQYCRVGLVILFLPNVLEDFIEIPANDNKERLKLIMNLTSLQLKSLVHCKK